MEFSIMLREDWGALTPRKKDPPQKHPLNYVFVTCVQTDVPAAGVDAVKELQKRDMFRGQADIQANFLIGGDGTAYEGRGWFIEPGSQQLNPGKEGEYLEITYLGDYSKEEYDHPVYKATGALLEIGVRNRYLSPNAKFLNIDEDKESPLRPLIPSALSQSD